MDLKDRIEAHKKLLTDRLDPDSGLLDELLAKQSLTRPEVAEVKAISNSYGRAGKLLEYVSERGIYDKFLDALKATKQIHLVNFILSNGQRCPEFGDDWPLTERETLILDANQRQLVDLLETTDLLPLLYSHDVVNNRQRDFVSTRITSHDKNDALMEILRRNSLRNYEKTIQCLHSSEQSHVARVFKEGGRVVRAHLELETESNVNEVEDEVITKITEMLGNRSLQDSASILECAQLRLIAAKRGNSIILYFFCKTSAEFANLQEMQASGKLANVVTQVFNTLLSRSEVINMRTELCDELRDEDFVNKCFGAKGELEESCEEDEGVATSDAVVFEQVTMDSAEDKVDAPLLEFIKCPICKNVFTDPRILPCIHTFCFECMRRTGEAKQTKPGDKMPCPMCRKEFTVPAEGIVGLQRNFFLDNLKLTLLGNQPTLKISAQTKTDGDLEQMADVKYCTTHKNKPFDNYCNECKKIVCVSCHAESHALHDCKEFASVEGEFRQEIKRAAWKISNYADELLSMKTNAEMRQKDFLKKTEQSEAAILKRNKELKEMMDRHTNLLLYELSMIKSNSLKVLENQVEEIESCRTILRSFESYCSELISKGSATDICSSINQLNARALELEKDHEAFVGRPHKSIEVIFKTTEAVDSLKNMNCNFVGNLEEKIETAPSTENFAVVVGLSDDSTATRDVVKINLHRSNEVSMLEQIPTATNDEAFAAIYCNTMYVSGMGINCNEIWKYSVGTGWIKCASLVQGRHRHSAAFIDEILYICGGYLHSDTSVLDSVEAYNAVTDKCTTVGKLVHCVECSDNCVPFKSSLYIFGGLDEDCKSLNHVQVYNTKENSCSVLSKPMPWPYHSLRAVLWETSVILLGYQICFIFNIETETWQLRKQFKTDVIYFGLALEGERLSVIGGGDFEGDKDGKVTWKHRDDVRYVPLQNIIDDKPMEWRIHATLPKPTVVRAYAHMRFPV